jgi:hypothetical protein
MPVIVPRSWQATCSLIYRGRTIAILLESLSLHPSQSVARARCDLNSTPPSWAYVPLASEKAPVPSTPLRAWGRQGRLPEAGTARLPEC